MNKTKLLIVVMCVLFVVFMTVIAIVMTAIDLFTPFIILLVILSYMNNFKLEYPNVLVAMLLQMEKKQLITLSEEHIVINPNLNDSVLTNTEKYLIYAVLFNQNNIIVKRYENLVSIN